MPSATLPARIKDTIYYADTPNAELPIVDSKKTDYDERVCCITSLPQPETGELKRDGYTECLCSGWFKRQVLSTPGFPSPIVHPPKVVYEVRMTRDSGLGLFAMEDIKAGDLIVAERPLVVKAQALWTRAGIPVVALPSHEMQLRHMEKAMDAICSRMSPETLKTFKSLHNSHKTDGSGLLSGIMRTNSFDIEVVDREVYKITNNADLSGYPCTGAISSRLNHSCSPNTHFAFNMPSFSMEIHAVRDVAKGEELTITYGGMDQIAAIRQTILKPYDFTCACPACKDPATWDEERKRVVESLLPKTSQGVEFAEATLAAYERTGMQSHYRYVDLLQRVAQICRKKGRQARADELQALAERVNIAQIGRYRGQLVDRDDNGH